MKAVNPRKVKAKIIETGWKIQDMANRLHMKQNTFSERLNARSDFRADELGAISEICGCSVDEFYTTSKEA